ncbi:B12-binding domain-containing radical SAM protein [Desulfomonile tiedjei]|uniref:Fe-S oxidoreductase n=1 Tax=Desulfomonile tiedjei (strain ATCC 49306 / DSM 6799 / DCB-1) TaxID=706587 RepID=I4C4H7_DESTA|nr:radical SAM protein [Desulfomonile tiedjei]AFM24468.1 Fe-S oxidoreductase [Desulfomonile tiedjei DSM 6799]
MKEQFPDTALFSGSPSDPGVVLVHPPAISKRYLRTKFMPYGMSVIYAFLKHHSVPVIQTDFLMEYLFDSPDDIDYHNPDRTFSQESFFNSLKGAADHPGLRQFVEKYGPKIPSGAGIYGFSIVAYHQYWAALLLGRFIRETNPQALIVFGGPFITIRPSESFVPHGIADYWVKGNGELPLLMLHALFKGRRELDLASIPGLVHIDEGRIITNSKSDLPAEQEFPPEFEGLDLSQYRYEHPMTGKNTFFLPYRISKGCPSRCSFCTGRLVDRYDYKSEDKVIRELKHLTSTYGTNNVQFADASINGNPVQLSNICDRIAEELPDLRWYAYARVKGCSKDVLEKSKKAGCFSLFWGVESADPRTVDLLGKRFDVREMHDLLEHAIAIGIKNYVHLMYNTPHESQKTLSNLTGFIDRYVDLPLVVLLPQRFLLEPQSLLFEKSDHYGLTNIRKVSGPVFEREQYEYDELGGTDHDSIMERNARHREILGPHLELIRCRNLFDFSENRRLKRFGPRAMMQLHAISSRSPLFRRLYDSFVKWMETREKTIREQL